MEGHFGSQDRVPNYGCIGGPMGIFKRPALSDKPESGLEPAPHT